ncbi:MAG: hypothetical protein AAFV93_05980 [Chloroflexota bacterium]
MRFFRKLYLTVLSLLVVVGLVTAQDDCPAVVDDALFSLSDLCLTIGRNQACYGNGEIVAVPVSGESIDFNIPGDTAGIEEIDSLALSPYSGTIADWGIAILVVQADIPDTLPGQNVTMLMFGETNLTNDNGAYYFTSGIGTPDCNQAPNGLLIQTPEGAGQVNLTLNGIDISIGSTAYFTFSDEDEFLIALLEGTLGLETDDAELELEPDFFTTIAIDEDGNATGDFAEPEMLEEIELPSLPTAVLPAPVVTGNTAVVSDELVIPQNGPWSGEFGDFVLSDGCPAMMAETMNAQGAGQLGANSGGIQDLNFDDGDVLGTLFLDFAESAFEEAGAEVTIDKSVTNIYSIIIGIENAAAITYTYTVFSDTYIEVLVLQDFSIAGLNCTVETMGILQYEG